MKPGVTERFWSKVKKGKGCWEWQASLDHHGYGQFMLHRGVLLRAHRVAWSLKHKEAPDKKFLLHRCDNRRCVRPSHLVPGSNRDNALDASAKGRLAKKLTWTKVGEIKALLATGETGRSVAKKYHVHSSTIFDIKAGRIWFVEPVGGKRRAKMQQTESTIKAITPH